VPQDEYLAALDSLVSSGEVRELGASNFTAPRLRAALDLAAAQGLTGFTVAQDKWSLVERRIETQLLPTLLERALVELPYASLAAGFFTGKYRPGQTVDSARAASAARYLDQSGSGDLLTALDEVAAAPHDLGDRGRPCLAAGPADRRSPDRQRPHAGAGRRAALLG
jgi:aryl-alcohol dehydrogenase-like predicted oxidoreductase